MVHVAFGANPLMELLILRQFAAPQVTRTVEYTCILKRSRKMSGETICSSKYARMPNANASDLNNQAPMLKIAVPQASPNFSSL